MKATPSETSTAYLCVGIDDQARRSLLINPIPAEDRVMIKCTSQIISLNIRNFPGQKVYSQHAIDSESMEITVTDLPAGIYIVSATTRDGILVRKLVVSH